MCITRQHAGSSEHGGLPGVGVSGDKLRLLGPQSSHIIGVPNAVTSIRHAPHGHLYFVTILYNPALHRPRRHCVKKGSVFRSIQQRSSPVSLKSMVTLLFGIKCDRSNHRHLKISISSSP